MWLQAKNITKRFSNIEVLHNVSLEIEKGEFVSILGKSGAGKSTLLHILGTLDKPTEGEIIWKGTHLSNLKDRKVSKFRNKHIGFVFQFHHLLPEFNTLENVLIPAYIAGTDNKTARETAQELLDYLELSNRLKHKPSELSGGEQQRVAVARALINKPDIVFADEPSGNLDSQTSNKLHQLMMNLRKDFNQTFVVVTHNKDLAKLSNRRIKMEDGKIVNA